MTGSIQQVHDGWGVPAYPGRPECTIRTTTRWVAGCPLGKRSPCMVHDGPMVTTYVRGAVPLQEHQKLLGTMKFRTHQQQGQALHIKAVSPSGNCELKETATMRPVSKLITRVIECEELRLVPKVEIRTVQRTVEVASKSQKHLIPKELPVDTPFIVPKFEDREIPVVMSETILPQIEETEAVVEVPVARYVPHLVPVNVYVPRAVAIPVELTHESKEKRNVSVPKTSLEQLMREMNPHLQEIDNFNASQNLEFQDHLRKSEEKASIAKCPVPIAQSTPLIKITEVTAEGEYTENRVKHICFSTGGYKAAEVTAYFESLISASTAAKSEKESLHCSAQKVSTNQDKLDSCETAPAGSSSIVGNETPEHANECSTDIAERVKESEKARRRSSPATEDGTDDTSDKTVDATK